MLQNFTATFSSVNPTDNVTSRQFHQFDKGQNETITILDPSAVSMEGSIDDAAAPGSAYLVDVNANGESQPSPSFALVPGPTPPPGGVPATPTILSVTFHA
jgi:hypothetical protein